MYKNAFKVISVLRSISSMNLTNSYSLRSILIFQDLVNWSDFGRESSFVGDEKRDFLRFFRYFGNAYSWGGKGPSTRAQFDDRFLSESQVLRTCCHRSNNSRDFFHRFFFCVRYRKREWFDWKKSIF